MSQPDDGMQAAYAASVRAFASMGARNLLALESDDTGVASLDISARLDGSVDVTLLDEQGRAVGGYSL